jgi:hypothetical protein
MESDNTAGGSAARGAPTFAVEAVVGLLVLVLGITVLWGSWHLGSGWTSDGPGPGYFPFYIGLIMCISAAGIVWQAIRKHDTGIFVDNAQLKQVLVVFIPALVYVLAVQFVGMYVASAIYIAVFMAWLGKFSPLKSIVAAVVIMVAFFLMFEVWFKVPLYKGEFNALQFTGY